MWDQPIERPVPTQNKITQKYAGTHSFSEWDLKVKHMYALICTNNVISLIISVLCLVILVHANHSLI